MLKDTWKAVENKQKMINCTETSHMVTDALTRTMKGKFEVCVYIMNNVFEGVSKWAGNDFLNLERSEAELVQTTPWWLHVHGVCQFFEIVMLPCEISNGNLCLHLSRYKIYKIVRQQVFKFNLHEHYVTVY